MNTEQDTLQLPLGGATMHTLADELRRIAKRHGPDLAAIPGQGAVAQRDRVIAWLDAVGAGTWHPSTGALRTLLIDLVTWRCSRIAFKFPTHPVADLKPEPAKDLGGAVFIGAALVEICQCLSRNLGSDAAELQKDALRAYDRILASMTGARYIS
jgi:hypothetical protein